MVEVEWDRTWSSNSVKIMVMFSRNTYFDQKRKIKLKMSRKRTGNKQRSNSGVRGEDGGSSVGGGGGGGGGYDGVGGWWREGYKFREKVSLLHF